MQDYNIYNMHTRSHVTLKATRQNAEQCTRSNSISILVSSYKGSIQSIQVNTKPHTQSTPQVTAYNYTGSIHSMVQESSRGGGGGGRLLL